MLSLCRHLPVYKLQDIRIGKLIHYSTPDGYFNPYYRNPYWLLDNNRSYTRNDYLTASGDVKFAPLSWLDFTYRLELRHVIMMVRGQQINILFSDFAKATTHGSYKKTDVSGSVSESSFYSTRLTSEFQAAFRRRFNDFNVRFIAGTSLRQDQSNPYLLL
jgi:hypothetical protein